MLTHTVLRVLVIALLLAPLLLCTSPTPPPYHQYSVSGVLERLAGGSKKDFAVVLLGKFRYGPDSTFKILEGIPYPSVRDHPIALTDSAGVFAIRVSTYVTADSLQLGVVVPGIPMTVGEPFAPDHSRAAPTSEWYTPRAGTGCSGCGTESETTERVVYYSYYLDGVSISIPF